jgi:acyl carrier protein
MTSFEGLCEIVSKDYPSAGTLEPGTLLSELGIDSLGMIELVFSIEDKFGVTASDADPEMAKEFTTLQDVADYIDRLIAQRDAPAAATPSDGAVAGSPPA